MSEHEVFTKPSAIPEGETTGSGRSPHHMRLIGYAAGVVLIVGLVTLAFWLVTTLRGGPAAVEKNAPVATAVPATDVPAAAQWQRPIMSAAEFADKVGVQIVHVAVTGGGGLIDLRFQVVDPDKANAIHDNETPPVIVDDETGLVVSQLLMGHSHSGPYTAGQTYYLLFENPGNIVQSGGKVSVLLGNAQVDHVSVQ